MFCIESLEERTLLSWPNAPFAPRQIDGAIYTNQYGYAQVAGRSLASIGQTDIYALSTAGGALKVNSSGPTALDLAYYGGSGQPAATDLSGHLSTQVPAGRPLVYLGVAGHQAATGSYGFVVLAPKPKAEQVKTVNNAAQIEQTVAAGSYQMFSFTVPQSGQWRFSVAPSKSLDASLIVFDNSGDPLGATYTKPIDSKGTGGSESWSGRLRAGARFAIRVDARTGSGALALRLNGPSGSHVPTGKATVTIKATRPAASEVGPKSGQFQISRSGSTAKPLTVQYAVSGDAKNGVDYAKLAGSATIPAGKSATVVTVKPLQDRLVETTESVVLTLKPTSAYSVASQGSATVTIADMPASLTWPKAPFIAPQLAETIYVNQYGDATITGQRFSSADDFRAYLVYWDDPSDMVVKASGTAKLEMAVYQRSGQPKLLSSTGEVARHVVGKFPIYIGVRPVGNSIKGTFALEFKGAGQGGGRKGLYINPKSYSAGLATDISNFWDSDFFTFTSPVAGLWQVTVAPTGVYQGMNNLDASLNIYNARGFPIGGTFTQPINAGGEGVPEVWSANLKAGTPIYIRVDGWGTSTGWYHVRVERLGPPLIDITATSPNAREIGPVAGQFTITRTGTHDVSQPLTVNYAIGGTGQNGVDYQAITGSATIPAGKDSVAVGITPIANQQAQANRSVVLSLLNDSAYMLGANTRATVTISDT